MNKNKENYNTFVLPDGVDEGDMVMNYQTPMEFNKEAADLVRRQNILADYVIENVEQGE